MTSRAPGAFRLLALPVDGTPDAERAVPLALALATRLGARLIVVRAGAPPDPRERTAAARGDDYLDALAARLRAAAPGTAVEAQRIDGDAAEAIAAYATARGVDLVVMATHAHGAVARALLGSVALDVVRRAGLPALLVPPHAAPPGGADAAETHVALPGHFLIPTDGSPFAERILEIAEPLAAALGARCTVFGAVDPIVAATALLPAEDDGEDELATRITDTVERLRRAGIEADAAVVAHARAAHAVADHATKHGVDLVALATHSRHGLGRLLGGSVADVVLHSAHCPVLLWHPADAE